MAKKIAQLRAHESPEAQARSTAKAREMLAEKPLNELRQANRRAKVCERAEEVFGSELLAQQWLHSEIRSIGGVQPVSLLDTDEGFTLVMDTLGRIEHGIAA